MGNNKEFDNILNECLESLLTGGETIEQCLAQYPEQALELRPLLETALAARKVSSIQPRPEFKSRARYQFRAALQMAMATIGGAQVLRLDHLTGSLEVGKKADIAVVDLGGPHIMPHFQLSDDNLYSQLVYAGKSSDVCHVLVNGRFLMRDRQLLTMDEA